MLDAKIYTLLQVYESGSFSAAAKKLSITQPAVSQHIKALEQELSVKLFDRRGTQLLVTKQGSRVIGTAKKMAGLEKLMMQELGDNDALPEHLTVGVTHTAESNPIAEALAKFASTRDGIRIKIISDSISNLYKKLRTYELDLAIVEGRKSDPSLKFVMLDTDYLILAVSPNHRYSKKGMISLEDLKKERLILRLPNSATRNLFMAHLESNNLDINEFNIILEIDNVATIKDLIRRDFGSSILPRSACLDELGKKKLVALPVENLSMVREMNIVYQSDFLHKDIINEIVKAYNETTKQQQD